MSHSKELTDTGLAPSEISQEQPQMWVSRGDPSADRATEVPRQCRVDGIH